MALLDAPVERSEEARALIWKSRDKLTEGMTDPENHSHAIQPVYAFAGKEHCCQQHLADHL